METETQGGVCLFLASPPSSFIDRESCICHGVHGPPLIFFLFFRPSHHRRHGGVSHVGINMKGGVWFTHEIGTVLHVAAGRREANLCNVYSILGKG